jgi:5-methylcytosine-specific restriction endonuclease McrA
MIEVGRKKRTPIPSGQAYYPLDYNFLNKSFDYSVQCSYCGRFQNFSEVTRDHVYPKSKGGITTVPSCYQCNEKKKDMLPIDWAVHFSSTEDWNGRV